jgi:hypothetical protein
VLETLGMTFSPANRGNYENSMAALREAVEPQQLAAAWAQGRGLSLEDALVEAEMLHAETSPGAAPR